MPTKDNKVNEGVEPQLSIGQSTIPFQTFFDIIAPAFGEKATKQDIMACLKRAHWVVNLKHATYIRAADGTSEADVPLVRHEDGETEFISEAGKKTIGLMRAGNHDVPDDWLFRRQWSHDLLTMLLEGNSIPVRTTTTRHTSPITGKTDEACPSILWPYLPPCILPQTRCRSPCCRACDHYLPCDCACILF